MSLGELAISRTDYLIDFAIVINDVFLVFSDLNMSETLTSLKVVHPMVKFQRQVKSLVKRNIVQPEDSIWKIALLFGDEWSHWKRELEDFEFSTKDPISELLAVESWEEE